MDEIQKSVAYCMSLYRLRIAEISSFYNEISRKYPDSKDKCWLLGLLKSCAEYEGPFWDNKNKKEEKKAEQEAILAYDKKFCYLFGRYSRPDDEEVIDVQIFLSVYSGACQGILKRLKYFKEIKFEETKISELIDHYSVILKCVGTDNYFTNFLKYYDRNTKENKMRDEARASFEQISSIWREIDNLLISILLVAADAKIDVTGCFNELEVFRTLRKCFRERLLNRNKVELEQSGSNSATKEQDKIFREHFSHLSYYYIFE